MKFAILRRSNLVSFERVARDKLNLQFYLNFCGRTSFRAKGLRREPRKRNFNDRTRNFTSVLGDRTLFRAKDEKMKGANPKVLYTGSLKINSRKSPKLDVCPQELKSS